MKALRQSPKLMLITLCAGLIIVILVSRRSRQSKTNSSLEPIQRPPTQTASAPARPVQFSALDEFMRVNHFATVPTNELHLSRTSSGLEIISSLQLQAVFERGRLIKVQHLQASQEAALRDSKVVESWSSATNSWTEAQALSALERIISQLRLSFPKEWTVRHQPNTVVPPRVPNPSTRFQTDPAFGKPRAFYTIWIYDTNEVMRVHAEWRMEYPEPVLTYWFVHL